MTALSILLIALILASLRRAHIRVEYSVSWLLASMAMLLFSLMPWLFEGAARELGIDYAPLALLFVIVSVFAVMFFRVSIVISKLKDDNIALAQRLAIAEFYVHSLRERESPRRSQLS